MENITNNEMLFILTILKNPEKDYNANSISKHMKISSMGALKIANRLEKGRILIPRKLGNAVFYKLNLDNDYVRQYVKFLLRREAEQAPVYVRRWINELKKIKSAACAILFGSILKKYEKAGDIDILLIIDKKRFSKLKEEIEDINLVNVKKIHPIYQTKKDLIENIKNNDKTVLSAVKGVVVFGEDEIIKLIKK